MDTIQYLCDVANGKRRRFLNVSPKAAGLFKQWVADWSAASELQDVLDDWEMSIDLDHGFVVRAEFDDKRKKRVRVDVRPRAPWEDGRPGPHSVNDELIYLVAALVSSPRCERLRVCPRCGKCFVAVRGSQKYCTGQCGRLAASARIVTKSYEAKRETRIKACRAAYAKYQTLKAEPRESLAEYVLREANRHLPRGYKLGGEKLQVNFITRHVKEIGIPKGEQ